MVRSLWAGTATALLFCTPAMAQVRSNNARELARLRETLRAANARLDAQDERLRQLEQRLAASANAVASQSPVQPGPTVVATVASPNDLPPRPGTVLATASPTPPVLERVGEVPLSFDNMPNLAVLGDNGSVITRPGQLTAEFGLEYARADRSRALFRGIEVVESVLVGTFDINESRQDVLSAAGALRYGVSSRFEVGARVPFVHRRDISALVPVMGSSNATTNDDLDTARGTGIGDVELTARYQITPARTGRAFLIGNFQVVAPTGSNPFNVPRDGGRPLKAATGAGFWGVSPSVTAILPSDPAVLFGTFGYTRNFGADVDTVIDPVRIVHVKPGDALSASAGIGITLNQRTSFNIGYAHTWAFGTKTSTVLLAPPTGDDGRRTQRARDLQIGRLLFGVTYRVNDRSSINWSVEAGATDDATDVRTVLRLPLLLLAGH